MNTNNRKIFTNTAITVATFFGGLIAAGLLMAKNYRAFGNHRAARISVFAGIISMFLLIGVILMVPEIMMDKVPQFLIPAFYTIVISSLVNKLQGQNIQQHFANGGEKASNWLAAGYGLISLVILGGFAAVIIFASSPAAENERVIELDKDVLLYYNENTDESKSRRMADVLIRSRFLADSEGADLFLSNEYSKYRLKFVIPNFSDVSDSLLIYDFNRLEDFLNSHIQWDKPIEIGFTDISLVHSVDLPEVDNPVVPIYEPLLHLLRYAISDLHTIFYNADVPVATVQKVEDAVKRLKAYFPDNQQIDIIFLDNGSNYTIKFFVIKDMWQNQGLTSRLISTVDYIQSSGLSKPLNLVLIDSQTFEEREVSD